jgi:hypothetical protein
MSEVSLYESWGRPALGLMSHGLLARPLQGLLEIKDTHHPRVLQ